MTKPNRSDRPHILFVDDEPLILKALERQIRRAGTSWRVTFETAPIAALESVKQAAPDVVVCDLAMPGMTGLDLIDAMRTHAPNTRFMMLTATGDLNAAMDAINRLGIFRFYTKPCPADVLIEGIEAALEDARAELLPLPASPEENTGGQTTINGKLGTAVLNQLNMGVLVLDRDAKLIWANRRGSLLLAEGDGLLTGADQVCRAQDANDSAHLLSLIQTALEDDIEAPAPMMSVPRKSLKRAYSLLFTPLSASRPGAHVALFIKDPEEVPLASPEGLAGLFDLSATEAKLVHSLASGARLEDAATEAGVTLSTARTYLKTIFQKTHTNRQADLVKLVMSTAPVTETR